MNSSPMNSSPMTHETAMLHDEKTIFPKSEEHRSSECNIFPPSAFNSTSDATLQGGITDHESIAALGLQRKLPVRPAHVPTNATREIAKAIDLNAEIEDEEDLSEEQMRRIRQETTGVGVLKDTCYQPKKFQIYSETKDAAFEKFSLEIRDKKTKMSLDLVDCPGIYEFNEQRGTERTTAQILAVINHCMRNNIVKIHCVVVFVSFETGIHAQDLEAVRLFKDVFKGCKIRLCVTRTENKPKSWKTSLAAQIKKIPELAESLNPASTEDGAYKLYTKVYQMRKRFLETMFEMKDPTPITKIGLVENKIKQCRELLQLYEQTIEILEHVTDFSTNSARVKIDDAAELMLQEEHSSSNPTQRLSPCPLRKKVATLSLSKTERCKMKRRTGSWKT
eukprot:g14854.t1